MNEIYYGGIENILMLLAKALLLYPLIILGIRVIGKRSTSQMNNFDWIVTVAIGSLFASTIILKGVTLAEGVISMALLLTLQYIINKLMLKFDPLKRIIRSTPQLLLYDGELLVDNMKRERILESEIWSAIRHSGLKSKDQVHAVVFETNATLSVIPKTDDDDLCFSIRDVEGLPEGIKKDLEER